MVNNIAEKLTVVYMDSEITDTRLMGALGMHVHWDVSDESGEHLDLHQFIRYDVDLSGIEFLAFARGDDPRGREDAIKEYFGALGGNMVPLTERQCRYLGNWFIESTEKAGHPIPDDAREMDFFTIRPVRISAAEKKTLMRKLCVPIRSDYGLVNYYLMRVFARDEEAVAYLRSEDASSENFDDLSFPADADLIKNTIEDFSIDGAECTYLCESVTDVKNIPYLVLSEVVTSGGRVVSAKKKLCQKLSAFEHAMILSKSEYINVFEIVSNEKALRRELIKTVGNGMNFDHAAGELFMAMRANNDHVEQRVFCINGDVSVMYFITNADQLLLCGNSEEEMFSAVLKLTSFIAASNIMEIGRYHMETPVFYDFIDSDYDDFEEFLADMREE